MVFSIRAAVDTRDKEAILSGIKRAYSKFSRRSGRITSDEADQLLRNHPTHANANLWRFPSQRACFWSRT